MSIEVMVRQMTAGLTDLSDLFSDPDLFPSTGNDRIFWTRMPV